MKLKKTKTFKNFKKVNKKIDELKSLLEKKKAKRKIMRRKPPRAPMTLELYLELLENIKKHTYKFVKVRDLMVCTLLWHTGCRINELKGIKQKQWEELVNNGKTSILEPKTNKNRTLLLSSKGVDELKQINEAEWFFQKAEGISLLASSKKGYQDMHPEAVIKHFNGYLKTLSKKFKVEIKTHSFRIGLITDMLKVESVNKVKDLIGHSHIMTTMRYNRYQTSEEERKEMVAKVR